MEKGHSSVRQTHIDGFKLWDDTEDENDNVQLIFFKFGLFWNPPIALNVECGNLDEFFVMKSEMTLKSENQKEVGNVVKIYF